MWFSAPPPLNSLLLYMASSYFKQIHGCLLVMSIRHLWGFLVHCSIVLC